MTSTPAGTTTHRSALATRLNRTAGAMNDWLRAGPVSVCLTIFLLTARMLEVSVRGPESAWASSVLTARLSGPLRPWSLLTAWAGTSHMTPLIGAVGLLVVGVAVERFLGSRRFLLTAVVSHVVTVALCLWALPLIADLWPAWARVMAHRPVTGVGLVLAGPLGAASALMQRTWRRRTRVLLLGATGIAAAVTATPSELARLAAAGIGIIIGTLAWRHARPASGLDSTPRSQRSVLTLLVTGWSLALALSVMSHAAAGPLAHARLNVAGSDAAISGEWTTLLALMPLVLQLLLALGLSRGRRVAAWGTVALHVTLALGTLGTAAVRFMRDNADDTISWIDWSAAGHAALPMILNIIVVLLVLWNRSTLQMHSRPGTVRSAALTWVGLAVALVAGGISLGLWSASSFTPQAGLTTLAADLLLHLLPGSAASPLAAALHPSGVLAHLAVQGVPLALWLVTLVLTWRVLDAPALTQRATADELTALVRAQGAGTLGWMLTWPGNEAWVSPDGATGFSYRPGGGVALTLSDPAAAPEDADSAVEEFAAFCSESGLVPALYSVHEDTMLAARARGWTVLQVAEEAVIDLPGLAFRGKAFQDVRTALNHAEREGITAVWTSWRQAPQGQRDQVRAISEQWSGQKALPEMGFTLGGLREIDDDDTLLLLAVDKDGTIHAVTSWMPVYRGGRVVGLTLDVMRKRENSWRPSIEFLIARAAQDAQAQGMEVLSLSGAPLARTGTSGDLTGNGVDDIGAARFDPVLDLLASLLEPAYGFASLHSFKRKFSPRRVPMYLAVPDLVDLPSAGLAVARAYVPDLTAAQAARFAQVVVSRD